MVMMGNGDCKDGQTLPKAKYKSYRIGCFTPFVAKSWNQPYLSQITHQNGLASIPTRTSWSSTPVHLPHDGCFAEDPVLFLQTDAATNVTRFKCIFHTYGEGTHGSDGDGCNHGNWHAYTGGYAEAVATGDSLEALLGEWSYNFSEPAYGGTVSFEDGKRIAYSKRERPKVVLDEGGVPVAVVNAVTAGSGSGAKFSGWTFTLSGPARGVYAAIAFLTVNRFCIGAFVWARRALNSQKWRVLARAVPRRSSVSSQTTGPRRQRCRPCRAWWTSAATSTEPRGAALRSAR
jgi:hypothetical protein